ncbi:centrosomal protein of 97 kDa isoform X1 [Danio aesculapii]|uniref:centrosomal protein of 97 kDa isoform X1 n=2 Tax=Danio aesculapii TaxID=1142201 RepID=UPI0024C0C182|nr:centrosomal protein of 97 kDa isoform X1 [Danio aesculapii]
MAATGAGMADPVLQMPNHGGPGVLDLSAQGLQRLEPQLFCPDLHTHTLILDQNQLMKLEHLEHNPDLQQLSVTCNRLVRMMNVCRLTQLRILNLQNNSIGCIEGLKELQQLEHLNLAGNNIKVMEQLHHCVSLQHLDLSDNNISQIGDVSRLSALQTLLLHGNIITTLRSAPAHLPAHLRVLSLAENEIRDLTEVCYLAPVRGLQQLSLLSNPCVSCVSSAVCDYRPYVLSWCLGLELLDGVAVSQKEGLKAEWLYSQGRGRVFRPGEHTQLLQYLSRTCPGAARQPPAEDAKLEKILNKQRHHQNQLQHTHHQSPSRPTHLDVQQLHHNTPDEDEDDEDVEPAVRVNTWMGSVSPPAAAPPPCAAPPPAVAADGLLLQDLEAPGPLASESAAHPASAPDSGEEEFEDSLAPPTSTQHRAPREEPVCRGVASEHQQCEPQDAAVRIQSWWRGLWTRQRHPQARAVRAEIRMRRMQDHIIHLSAQLDRVRRQQEEERLQRRVQEEAVKVLWKQLQVLLQWQASVDQRLNTTHTPALNKTHTPPDSATHTPADSSTDTHTHANLSVLECGSPCVNSSAASGDAQNCSLLEQYLSSVQQQDEEERAAHDL